MTMTQDGAFDGLFCMKIPARIPSVQLPRSTLEQAARTAEQVKQTARPEVDAFVSKAKAVGMPVLEVVGSSSGWGKSIGVDDSTTAPRRFDHGARKPTLAGFDTSSPDRSGVRGRLFGEVSKRTASAAIGLEAEAGAKSKYRNDDREQTGDAFAGVRGRVFAEAGLLGGSVGAEGFAGAELYSQEGDERGSETWMTGKMQAQVGVRGAAIASADILRVRANTLIEAGASFRHSSQLHNQLVGPIGMMSTTDTFAFVGARGAANVGASLKGLSAGVEVFAGARAGLEQRLALAAGGTELLGAGVRFEAWAGAGAKAEVKAGYDAETGEVGLGAEAGAAVGVGAGVSGNVTFNGTALGGATREAIGGLSTKR